MPLNRGMEETQRATKYLTFPARIVTSEDFSSKHVKFLSFQMNQMTAKRKTFRIILPLLNPTPNLQNSSKDGREWGMGVETWNQG